jgi:hypothetical protein
VCAELETTADRARKEEEAEASAEHDQAPATKVPKTGRGKKPAGNKAEAAKPTPGKKQPSAKNAKIKVTMPSCVIVLCLFRMPHASPHIVMSRTMAMLSCAPLASHTNSS